jgi:hypothetical protein
MPSQIYVYFAGVGLACLCTAVRRAAVRRVAVRRAAVEQSFLALVSSAVAELPTLQPTLQPTLHTVPNVQNKNAMANAIANAVSTLRSAAKRGDAAQVASTMWRAAQRGDVAMLRICLASKLFFDKRCRNWHHCDPEFTAFKIAARNGHVDCVKCLLVDDCIINNWDDMDVLEGSRCAIYGHASAEMLRLLMLKAVTWSGEWSGERPNEERGCTYRDINRWHIRLAAAQGNVVALNVMADAVDAEFVATPNVTVPQCIHAPKFPHGPCRPSRLCEACRIHPINRFADVHASLQSAMMQGDTAVVAQLLQRQCTDDRLMARTWWLRAKEYWRLQRQLQRQEARAKS